jgi:hypothetical protein
MRREQGSAVLVPSVGLGLCLLCLVDITSVSGQQPVAVPEVQTVRGVVVDSSSGAGIPGASVTSTESGRRALSDSVGAFVLSEVPLGAELLRVEGFGYEDLIVPVSVTIGMEPLEVRLQPSPIELEGIDVRGRGSRAALSGVVVDAVSGEGIPFAALWLRDERRAATNERGAFRLDRVPPGSYLLLAQRMGYHGLYVHVQVSAQTEPVVIRLDPDPLVLEGIVVVNDRLRYRRNAHPRLVRTYDENKFRRTGASDMYGFLKYEVFPTFSSLRRRSGLWGVAPDPTCPAGVYIDDQYIMGGLDVLSFYHPSQLYLLEVFGPGGQIRAYTHDYIESQAGRPRMLEPADLPPPGLPGC